MVSESLFHFIINVLTQTSSLFHITKQTRIGIITHPLYSISIKPLYWLCSPAHNKEI